MRKRIASILCCLLLYTGLLITPANAATIPAAKQKTETLSQEHVRYQVFDENVTIKLTYTGYIGEVSAKNWAFGEGYEWGDIKIPVLADGSEIIFEIISKNPAAYYNFCYEKTYTPHDPTGNFMDYPWDDCGGGSILYADNGLISGSMPIFVFYKGGGTSKASAGTFQIEPYGRKLASNKYSYKVQNGLVRYDFHATEPLDNGRYLPQGMVASYWITTALSVTAAQVQELEKTGNMTFTYKSDYPLTYKYNYPGLGKLFGIKAKEPLSLTIDESDDYIDNGICYEYTLTNNTESPIKKYSALITYNPEMISDGQGSEHFVGQIHTIDIDLAAGANVTKPIISYFTYLSGANMLWIDFDSLAERDSFFEDKVFGERSSSDIQGYHIIDRNTGHIWMKDTLGITIKPAK